MDAIYYDGHTTRPRRVRVALRDGVLAWSSGGRRHTARLSELTLSEPLLHAPRMIRLPHGGVLEVHDPALRTVLAQNGYREPRVVRWQQRWPLALMALVALLAMLTMGYRLGLPRVADMLAQRLPQWTEQRIGDEQLRILDAGGMRPSRLAPAEQDRLRRGFAALRLPDGGAVGYRLEFRDAGTTANAFALPNGVIVLTDRLVRMARSDREILAALGHEDGHLQRRHASRRLLQSLGVGAVVGLLLGDMSEASAAAPALLLEQAYSRGFEREADRFAIDMMSANGIAPSSLADLLEKMASNGDIMRQAGRAGYFSSHPGDAERLAALRNATLPQ